MRFFKKFLISLCAVVGFVSLVSCSNNETSDDYQNITKTLKLTKAYEGKHFVNDGIGAATVVSIADGDTATFELIDGMHVTIRFYNIDTPESTGKVQKWGKSASNFTKGKINGASDIVLEATSTPASNDSYGVRYLGYVWYRDSADDQFKNLNLEIVENGYSRSTAATIDPYFTYFRDADKFAAEKKLHVQGDDEDPNYTDTPEITTLKTIVEDIAKGNESKYYNPESSDGMGAYVRFDAYVKRHEVRGTSSATNYYYVASYEDGEEYTFTLYGGYSSDSINSYIVTGNMYSFVGYIQYYNGSFQVAIGGTYQALKTGPKLMNLVQKGYYVTFDSSNERYSLTTETSLLSDLTITSVNVNNGQAVVVGTAKNTDSGTEESYTLTVVLGENENFNYTVGQKIKVSGYQETENSKQIKVLSINNIR